MKENSIEEDIKDIEKYISFTSKRENFSHDTDWNWNKDLANKIEHILSDYKRVLKENERYRRSDYETICLENNELRETVDRIQSEYNDLLKEHEKLKAKIDVCNWQEKSCKEIIQSKYISIQKVKDKIEELKAQYKTALEENSTEAFILKCQITILQELIEEREEK